MRAFLRRTILGLTAAAALAALGGLSASVSAAPTAAAGGNTPTTAPNTPQATPNCTSDTSCNGTTCCTTTRCRGQEERIDCRPQTLRSTQDDNTPQAQPAPSTQGGGK